MIPEEIVKKYECPTLEECTCEYDFYCRFMDNTEDDVMAMIESFFNTIRETTALNFVTRIIQWINSTARDSLELARWRTYARAERARLEVEILNSDDEVVYFSDEQTGFAEETENVESEVSDVSSNGNSADGR